MDSQKNALYFCAGLAIGILGTLGFLWFYQEPADSSIDISEDGLSKDPGEVHTLNTDGQSSIDNYTAPVPEKQTDYAALVAQYGIVGDTESQLELYEHTIEPHRISEEDFEDGNIEGNYDIYGLTLYADGILADSTNDDIMSESDAFVALGPNYTARHLHEIFERALDYSDDPIFIRNDKFFSQYEILYDKRTYKEVTGRNPDGSYGT